MASQELLNAQKLLETYRKRDGVKTAVSSPASPAIVPTLPHRAAQPPIQSTPEHVRAYPTLLAAFHKAQLTPVGRVYHLLRAMDAAGRNCGWLPMDQVNQLADEMTPWYVMGGRRLRQIIGEGEGVTWTYEKAYSRLRFIGAAQIAENLSVERLTGAPVQLPITSLLGGIQDVRAAFLAAFHAGRRGNDPISRSAIASATGAAPSSQRTYDKISGTKSRVNYELKPHSDIDKQDAAWQSGRAGFVYTDWVGKIGPRGKQYQAQTLPNSYTPALAPAAKGRQRKVNRKITRVNNEARGNDSDVNQRYYQDAASAGKAYDRDCQSDKYYRRAATITPTAKTKPHLMPVDLWGVLPGQRAS